MGTNYYVKENYCSCCGRHEKKHIGKSSWGWEFHFRGYKDEGIVSFSDWKNYLVNKTIVNEYGENVSTEEFLSLVETKSPGSVHIDGKPLYSFYDYCMKNEKKYIVNLLFNGDTWKDKRGFSFSNNEFS